MTKKCIVIAVGAIRGHELPGVYPVADRIVSWAVSQGFCVDCLRDDQVPHNPVTLTQCKRAIAAALFQGDCDKLLIYFVGHGATVASDSQVWLLSDVVDNGNEVISVGPFHFAEVAARWGVKHLIVVSDACREWKSSPPEGIGDLTGSGIWPTAYRRASGHPQVDIFYACEDNAQAWLVPDSHGGNTLFSQAWLELLSRPNADLCEDCGQNWVVRAIPLGIAIEEAVIDAAGRLDLDQRPRHNPRSAAPHYVAQFSKSIETAESPGSGSDGSGAVSAHESSQPEEPSLHMQNTNQHSDWKHSSKRKVMPRKELADAYAGEFQTSRDMIAKALERSGENLVDSAHYSYSRQLFEWNDRSITLITEGDVPPNGPAQELPFVRSYRNYNYRAAVVLDERNLPMHVHFSNITSGGPLRMLITEPSLAAAYMVGMPKAQYVPEFRAFWDSFRPIGRILADYPMTAALAAYVAYWYADAQLLQKIVDAVVDWVQMVSNWTYTHEPKPPIAEQLDVIPGMADVLLFNWTLVGFPSPQPTLVGPPITSEAWLLARAAVDCGLIHYDPVLVQGATGVSAAGLYPALKRNFDAPDPDGARNKSRTGR